MPGLSMLLSPRKWTFISVLNSVCFSDPQKLQAITILPLPPTAGFGDSYAGKSLQLYAPPPVLLCHP